MFEIRRVQVVDTDIGPRLSEGLGLFTSSRRQRVGLNNTCCDIRNALEIGAMPVSTVAGRLEDRVDTNLSVSHER